MTNVEMLERDLRDVIKVEEYFIDSLNKDEDEAYRALLRVKSSILKMITAEETK